MKRYRAAIIGCGRIGSLFDDDPKRKGMASHAGAYTSCRQTVLAAACDLREDRLKLFGKRWGVQALYPDYRAMLREVRPELLSVCTWADSHLEVVQAACEAGVKAIFCEKPLADTLEHAKALIASCQRHRVALAVDFWRRWDPFHQRLAGLISQGRLGRLEKVVCHYASGVANSGSHLFDLLRWFVGDLETVQAFPTADPEETDPSPDGWMQFRSGARGALFGYPRGHHYLFELDLMGSKGRVRVSEAGNRVELWTAGPSKWFSGLRDLQLREATVRRGPQTALRYAVQDLVRCLRQGTPPQCTGEDGLRSMELVNAIQQSLSMGRPVALSPEPLEAATSR